MPERWLTYAEAGALLGMTPEAVRQRARRHDWPTRKTGNKPNDPNEVLIPDSVPVHLLGQPTARPNGRTVDHPPGQPGDAATVADTMAALAAELRATQAERDMALTEAAEARREAQQEWEHRARAEGERDGLREAVRVAEDGRRAVGAERDAALVAAAARRDAEVQAVAAAEAERRARKAAERELAEWMAGGPVARAWRAFLARRRGP